MKVLPDRHKIAEAQQSGQTLGRGMDFTLVMLVFLGIGYGLDRLFGTRPVFMIALVVFSVVGQFLKMYFEYSASMQQHEAERLAAQQRQPRYQTPAAPAEEPAPSVVDQYLQQNATQRNGSQA